MCVADADAATRERLLEPVRGADVIIAAVGFAEVVRGDWVKPGGTVVDVGINAVLARGTCAMDEVAGSHAEQDGRETVFRLPGKGDFKAGAYTRSHFSST